MSEVLIRGYKAKEQIEEIIKAAMYGSNNCMIDEGLTIDEIPPHGDLIERDALEYSRVYLWHEDPTLLEGGHFGGANAAVLSCEIKDAPVVIPASDDDPTFSYHKTADVGEWVECFGDVRCSACGAIVDGEVFYMLDPYQLPKFCPLCGAQMREVSNEDD